MQIDEIITVLKTKVTPSLLKVIIDLLKTHVVFLPGMIVAIRGMESGNVRITVRHNVTKIEELFVLNFAHFQSHPLKINQWK